MEGLPKEVIDDLELLNPAELTELRGILGSKITALRLDLNDIIEQRGEMLAYKGVEVSQDPTLLERRMAVAREKVRLELLLSMVIETRGEMDYHTQVPD